MENNPTMKVDSTLFKKALSHFASGVTIVTYRNGKEDSGITVSAFSSVSLEPPLVLVCISIKSPAVSSIRESKGFTVNILHKSQVDISNAFASQDNSRIEYLKNHANHRGENGILQIPESLACIECDLYADYEGGDHRIFVGRVSCVKLPEDGSRPLPLLYYNKNYRTTQDL